MDISAKTEHWIETGTAVGTGILAWENAATAKWAQKVGPTYGSLFSKNRFCDALAGIIGNQATKAIVPSWTGVADMHPNLFGALNKTSLSGAAILVADAILREVIPQYNRLDGIPSIVKGAGMGILGGGIVGGIFDPNPSGFTAVSPSPVTGQIETGGVATGNVPFSTGSMYQGSVLQ
jgi:hypothetical protein